MPTGSSIAYLDASALVKLAIEEDETKALRDALAEWPRRVSSRISVVEVLRAVRRRDETALPLAGRVLAHVVLLAIGDKLLVQSAALDPPSLRALDAVHLASALRLESALSAFVSYDERQLSAAEALGLPAFSPR